MEGRGGEGKGGEGRGRSKRSGRKIIIDNARQMHTLKAASDFQKTELPRVGFETKTSRTLDGCSCTCTCIYMYLQWRSTLETFLGHL